ncbi:PQQ-binding-like beta-propeller repeat protein [candidate division FCPU426 bacterium]|nr:PQQ-binding-like beta-propeller repeat protein [candidate division FCPU426 bacterium]
MNTLQLPEEKRQRLLPFYLLVRNLAVVSGCFSSAVFIILVLSFWQFNAADPINDPHLPKLIEQIQAGNNDPAFLDSVRAYDQLIRKAHFTALAFTRFGAYLLLGGISLFLLFLKLAFELHRQLPRPDKFTEPEENQAKTRVLQYVILGFSFMLVLSAFLLPYFFSAPWFMPAQKKQARPVVPLPAEATWRRNWPAFRGYHGLGIAPTQNPPLDWDANSNKNILWKTKIPKPGFNSPLVWEDRVFLSGADQESRTVFCFDAATGNLRWQKSTSAGSAITLPKVSEDTGLAAPTMATDGRFVSAIFATGELLTLSLQGEVQWEKKLPRPDNHYGHASSLITYQGILLVQYDSAQNAKLMAFDLQTGRKLWEKKRQVEISWTSPIIAPTAAGDQLILTATPLVVSYQPGTGKVLWQLEEVIGGEIGPSPAFDQDLLFFINQYSRLACVDVARQQIKWETDHNLSDIPSPVASQGYLIVPTSFGKITCYDGASGAVHWEHRFETGFHASPIICGDKVYALDTSGIMRIFKLERTFIGLANPRIAEACAATPAFVDQRIFIRGDNHLYCIGSRQP